MIRYLSADEVLELHRRIIAQSGGSAGIRDIGGVDSAIAQPQMTFGGNELYPDIADKAAAIGFSLVCNHPFVDGNKRIGHAAMEVFLVLNGWEIDASQDGQENVILAVAASQMSREGFTAWVRSHLKTVSGSV